MADDEQTRDDPAAASRRAVLKIGVGVVGAGVGLIPLVPAVGYFAFPLTDEVTSSGDDFLTVGKRGTFGQVPVRVDVHADRVDAWNRVKDVKIGSAWVVEVDGKLTAFSTVCPHLGCAVDFDAAAGKFKCPCHRSAFGVAGTVEEGPSPRALDTLEVREDGGLVAIRYQRFRQGVASKEVV